MGLPLIQADDNPEQPLQTSQLPTDRVDQTIAQFQAAWHDTAIHNISDLSDVRGLNKDPGQETLSIEDLNKRYPGNTWTEPKKANVAKFIDDKQQERNKLQSVIERGPQDMTSKALGFGAGVAAHLLDPLELATFVAGGEAVEGANIIRGGGLAATTARGALGAAVGQVPLTGLKDISDTSQNQEVTLGGNAMDIAQAAVGGGLLHVAGHYASPVFQSAKERALGFFGERLPEDAPHISSIPQAVDHPAVIDNAAAQFLDGRKPTVEPFEKVFERERMSGGPKPENDFSTRSQYEFRPIDTSAPVERKMYVGTNSHAELPGATDLKSSPNSMQDFGHGTYLVDDPYVANGYAASSFSDTHGVIHEFDLKDAKLLSAEEPMPKEAKAAIVKSLAGEPIEKSIVDNFKANEITASDLFKAAKDAPKDIIGKINDALKGLGYDGIHFVQEGEAPGNEHNGVMLFDGSEKKLSHVNAIDSDPKWVGGLSDAEKANISKVHEDPSQKMFHDPDMEQRLNAAKEAAKHIDEPFKQPDLDRELQDLHKEINDLAEGGHLPEDLKEQVSSIKESMEKASKLIQDVAKNLFDCIGAN